MEKMKGGEKRNRKTQSFVKGKRSHSLPIDINHFFSVLLFSLLFFFVQCFFPLFRFRRECVTFKLTVLNSPTVIECGTFSQPVVLLYVC